MLQVFHDLPRLDIPRVAINMTGRMTQCCNFDGVRLGGVSLMQALHGLHLVVPVLKALRMEINRLGLDVLVFRKSSG